MASDRKIAANRRNALMSTGPRTEPGKLRTRKNAIRHGLTAETVIHDLEDADQYRAFEAAVMVEYDPKSTVARELVFRLASLLWRLRRATAIEAGLLAIQAEIHRARREARKLERQTHERRHAVIHNLLDAALECENNNSAPAGVDRPAAAHESEAASICGRANGPRPNRAITPRDLAQCFLRLANLDEPILERIGHHEMRLWRQAAQIIFTIETLRRSRTI